MTREAVLQHLERASVRTVSVPRRREQKQAGVVSCPRAKEHGTVHRNKQQRSSLRRAPRDYQHAARSDTRMMQHDKPLHGNKISTEGFRARHGFSTDRQKTETHGETRPMEAVPTVVRPA